MEAKKLRLLATTTQERLKDFPDTPTLKEQGVNLKYEIGRYVFGPKDMPADVVAYWKEAFEKTIATPEWQTYLIENQLVNKVLFGQAAMEYFDNDVQPILSSLKYLGVIKE